MNLFLGLVHYPVKNKHGEVVTTSVTNMDLHDMARSAKTFGVKRYFVITPLRAQWEQIQAILGHWKRDKQNDYNPDRANALGLVELTSSIEEATRTIELSQGCPPKLVATGAGFVSYDCDASKLAHQAALDGIPYLLLFGTGWGLHGEVVARAHYRLRPILSRCPGGYNHLSVRAAVAIYLDRMDRALGEGKSGGML